MGARLHARYPSDDRRDLVAREQKSYRERRQIYPKDAHQPSRATRGPRRRPGPVEWPSVFTPADEREAAIFAAYRQALGRDAGQVDALSIAQCAKLAVMVEEVATRLRREGYTVGRPRRENPLVATLARLQSQHTRLLSTCGISPVSWDNSPLNAGVAPEGTS